MQPDPSQAAAPDSPSADKPRGLFVMGQRTWDEGYGPTLRDRVHQLLDLPETCYSADQLRDRPELLRGVEVLVTGWGAPALTEELLKHADALRFVVYGAGSVAGCMTHAAWDRGIRITSGYVANAQPVAEFTVATIILALKHAWSFDHFIRANHAYPHPRPTPPGNYGTPVGLVSLGAIGRLVADRLKAFDHKVFIADPTITDDDAAQYNATRLGLEELFATCMCVSLHTPWLKETEGLISGPLMRSMPEGAALINTSRGAVIDEPALCRVAADRPDLRFILDVTYPEPPAPDSPLYRLPNVTLTPHIAGSQGGECQRMGQYVVTDLELYLRGEPLHHEVTKELAYSTSHRPKQ